MPIQWTEDPHAFATRAWRSLCDQDPEASVFHSPRYLKLYWEELGAGRLQIAEIGDGDEPLARAAFELREGTLWFLGGTEVTDYMGPVGRPDARDRAAKELMAGLAARDDWERADLRGMPEDGPWLSALAHAAEAAGIRQRVEDEGIAPFLSLPSTFEEYLAGLSSKRRHEVRRKERRLFSALPDAALVDAVDDGIDAALDRFLQLHRSSGGPKGRFMQPGMELFFRRLAHELPGVVRLTFLQAGDERLAGLVAFRWRGSLLLYNSAYDPSRRDLSPGIVLVTEVVRDAIASGCGSIDMLKGDLDYKYRFGATPRRIPRLLLRR